MDFPLLLQDSDPSQTVGFPEISLKCLSGCLRDTQQRVGGVEQDYMLTERGFTMSWVGGGKKQRIDSDNFILPPAGSWRGLLGEILCGSWIDSFSFKRHTEL